MKHIKWVSFSLAGLFLVLFCAHSQSITGTWTFNNGNFPVTMLLLNNGTGEFQGMPVKYKTQDGKLYVDDGIQPITYNYMLTQTTLTLSGGGLQAAITFTRPGSSSENTSPVYQKNIQSNTMAGNANTMQSGNMSDMAGNPDNKSAGGSDILGIWEGQQGKVLFYPDGTLLYNGTSYLYSASGNSIAVTGTDGSTTFTYSLVNNKLTLSQNASSSTYSKTSALKPDRIDPQLVGKWCIVSGSTNYALGGGSSSEECITLNANGSYEYFYSASRTAYTVDQSAYGGTANQNSDRGSWKTDGVTLVSVSQTTGKTSRYSLAKINEQNGDAAIVVGGRKFVTAYNRPGW
jgi:hypothetical protein